MLSADRATRETAVATRIADIVDRPDGRGDAGSIDVSLWDKATIAKRRVRWASDASKWPGRQGSRADGFVWYRCFVADGGTAMLDIWYSGLLRPWTGLFPAEQRQAIPSGIFSL